MSITQSQIKSLRHELGLEDTDAALKQLEQSVNGLPQQIERKLDAIRRQAWDTNGRYRGVFASEDDARCFGLVCLAEVGHISRATEQLTGEMKGVFERAMSGDPTSLGGGLVPVEYAARIQRLVEQFGLFAKHAFNMPMSSDSLTYQRRTAGLTVFKTGQNTATTASDMGFSTINLNSDEWNVLALVPLSMMEDSVTEIGELVAIEIAQSFAEQIDFSGFVGAGNTASLDVLGLTTLLSSINGVDDGGGLVLGTGNAGDKWAGLVEADFTKLISILPTYRGIEPAFYCSNQFFWTVMVPIILASGGVTRAEFVGEQTLMFLGYPVRITPKMPTIGADSQIACLFGDLALSSDYGVRKQLMIAESRDVRFLERQLAILGTKRRAINNHSMGSETEAGAMVGLITPVSV